MPRGGARPGAGRPKKPLNEKLLDGNPGRRDLTVLKFRPNNGHTGHSDGVESKNHSSGAKNQKPKLPTYLDLAAKEGGDALRRLAKSTHYLRILSRARAAPSL